MQRTRWAGYPWADASYCADKLSARNCSGLGRNPPSPSSSEENPRADNAGRRVTRDDYDKEARELKKRQTEPAFRVEQHQDGEDAFRTRLGSLISVASRAAEIFERSKIEQKCQLLYFVFSNRALRRRKLEVSLASPFDLKVDRPDYPSWLAFLDTVRTERFAEVAALQVGLPAFAVAV